MRSRQNDNLAELCDRAMAESDPEELIALFREINHILRQHILDVDEVIQRQRERGLLSESSPFPV